MMGAAVAPVPLRPVVRPQPGRAKPSPLETMVGTAKLKDYLSQIEFSFDGDTMTGTLCVMAAPARSPEAGNHLTMLCIQDSVDLAQIRSYYETLRATKRTREQADRDTFENAARRRIIKVIEGVLLSHPGIVSPMSSAAAGGFLDGLKKFANSVIKVVEPVAKGALSAYVGPQAAEMAFKVAKDATEDKPKAVATVQKIAAQAKAGNPEAQKAADALRMADEIKKKAEAAQRELEQQRKQFMAEAQKAAAKPAPSPAPAPTATRPAPAPSGAPSPGGALPPGGAPVTIVNNIAPPNGAGAPVVTRYQPPPLAAASGESAGGWMADTFRGWMTRGGRG